VDKSQDLSYAEKYHYVKILRAQLTTDELCIFYYSLFSDTGQAWENSTTDKPPHLVSKYNLLKNIPPGYCAYNLAPEDHFPDICYEGRNDSSSDKQAHFRKFEALDKKYST
jgi:hypothetical protein